MTEDTTPEKDSLEKPAHKLAHRLMEKHGAREAAEILDKARRRISEAADEALTPEDSVERDPFHGKPVYRRDDMEVAHYDEITGTQYYKDLVTEELFFYSPELGRRVNA